MRLHPRAAGAGIAIAIAVAGALAFGARGAAPASRVMTFIDADSGLALAIQVEPAARDAGAFVFRVPGRGIYEGDAGRGMVGHSANSITVNYDGPATLRVRTGIDVPVGATIVPAVVTISVQAQIDPSKRTAEATLTDGTARFHLNTRNDNSRPKALELALGRFEAAIVAQDWTTLYALMNRDVRAAYSAAAFAAQGSSEAMMHGRIIRATRLATGGEQRTDHGAVFIAVRYAVDVSTPSGTLATTIYDAFFIPEGDAWSIWYTAVR